MDFIKAGVLGAVLAGVVALVIGSQGSSGGFLYIHLMAAGDFKVFWSWPLFLVGTGLSWALMIIQR
ncbi:MAG: hypothetical protein V2J51_12095 [Erythrobacter sp.]|nr:hypothetical protein [Erythrobacter sp.]